MNKHTQRLLHQLKRHEGFRGVPYVDPAGVIRIGYGRNLNDHPLTEEDGEVLLVADMARHAEHLVRAFPEVQQLDEVRRAALMNMAFSLGVPSLAAFVQMWRAIGARQWERAADEFLDSHWAYHIMADRAQEVAMMLRTGEWPAQEQ